MEKYYELLGVTPFSSLSEIKHAFRQRAKLLHPDLQTEKERSKHNAKMTELLEAYRFILNNHNQFADRGIFENKRLREFNYRQWLLEQEDYESRAKLIVFDLFHENEQAAVEEYLRLLNQTRPFYFFRYFSREDFMDYGFVLAEELFFLGHHYESFQLLKDIVTYETEKPYFRHFFPEVITLIKKTLDGLTLKTTPIEKITTCYQQALSLQLPSRTKKSIEKKLRERV